ncbi:cathepsin L1-like [Galendromus occidentalis]|uniref:Cathepsin L1-like n=1 Tax=Galendromus occidentalis TaxID=34638 RepID=A0AAJ6QNJ5_9ACAR|nr:cathepsin L1-like [Galendromus occidentalis]
MHLYRFLSLVYGASLAEWSQFKEQFGKEYRSTSAEEIALLNFGRNSRTITEHNKRLHDGDSPSYRMAVNPWSDKSHEEFRQYYGLYGDSYDFTSDRILNYVPERGTPANVDWNKAGFVTPSRDQKGCGSCWAFAAVGAIEARVSKSTGNLTALSVQNLIDCSDTNFGCSGGSPILALRDLLSIGLHTADSYPYLARDGICHRVNSSRLYQISGFYREEYYLSEERLKEMVAIIGPVTATIDASPFGFMHYRDGIFYDPACNPDSPNHAVLVVGFGIENGFEYWLIKNSWGPDWGIDGFMKIARNRNNTCGIANSNAFPIL